ncbi:MAG: NAD(P)/FAD-dependent oxidoreductase [Bryobacteraceae bacterium]
MTEPVIIVGAGPAGLTAAYELSRAGRQSVVLEADGCVGGIARTAEYKGYLFDLGGHRFFTKVGMVERVWHEVLGEDMLVRPRLSRIYYGGKFFQYPLEPWNVVRGLGPVEVALCGLSYLKARLLPTRPEDDLATWVTNRFGDRLFQTFFRSYTEKVWGIPCNQIRAEWAAQRIRGLSLRSVIKSAIQPYLPKKTESSGTPRTLVTEFLYPRRGPGQMWTAMQRIVESRGSRVLLRSPVERIYWEPGKVTAVEAGGQRYEGDQFISTLPIRDLLRMLDPAPPAEVLAAADDFSYRDFLTVALMVKGRDLFPDNWIYIHEPNVAVGRIQNYTNWSEEMSPDPAMSCLGLEYFCSEGDPVWSMGDADLIEMGRRELAQIGLVDPMRVVDGCVVRVKKAYPVYDGRYAQGLTRVREWLPAVPNLQLVGRNGQHRYNNQDHSMLTAMLAARNILGAKFDLWELNTDQDYHEEGMDITDAEIAAMEAGQPRVPRTTSF